MDAFLDQLEPGQFDEWWAADAVDPWGGDRDDVRIGRLACALESLFRTECAWSESDFVLSRPVRPDDDDAGDDVQPLEDQAEAWRLFAERNRL